MAIITAKLIFNLLYKKENKTFMFQDFQMAFSIQVYCVKNGEWLK